MSANKVEEIMKRLEADLAQGDDLSLSPDEFRRIRTAIANGEYAKRLLLEARERALDGADLYEAFPTLFGTRPRKGSNPKRDSQRIAMHYRYLTGQVGAWACYDGVDAEGKRCLPWSESPKVTQVRALEIIGDEYEFASTDAAWTCLDDYRQKRREAVEAGDLASPDQPEWIELPDRPS
jgi:hypothetical protein